MKITTELHARVNTDSYIFTTLSSEKRTHLFQLSINSAEMFNAKQTHKEVCNKMCRYISILWSTTIPQFNDLSIIAAKRKITHTFRTVIVLFYILHKTGINKSCRHITLRSSVRTWNFMHRHFVSVYHRKLIYVWKGILQFGAPVIGVGPHCFPNVFVNILLYCPWCLFTVDANVLLQTEQIVGKLIAL